MRSPLSREFFHPVVVAILAFTLSGQHLPGQDKDSLKVYRLAREAGEIAGHAIYCNVDSQAAERYIIRINSRIALEAQDDFDLVSARILFRNIRDARSGAAPAGGCGRFVKLFEEALQRVETRPE